MVRSRSSVVGFTLIESVVVVMVVGILAAIAAPAWVGLVHRQKLNTAASTVLAGMREAQSRAIQTRSVWQFSLREVGDRVEWTVSPSSGSQPLSNWQALPQGVRLDGETTLRGKQFRYVRFGHLGEVHGQLGRATFRVGDNAKMKRCVIVSTLLGAVRLSADNIKAHDGKLCY